MDRARFRFLRVALTQRHRYRRYRALTMTITMAVLILAPIVGVARVDLWGGAHRMLGHPVDLAAGLSAVFAAIAAFYGVTFLINMFAGRMFCGFGCPVGQLCRFADAIDAFPNEAGRRRRGWLYLVGFASTLAVATVLWWVAPQVFVSGDGKGLALTGGALGLLVAYSIFHARLWRWGFCRKFCPIGLYYTVVQTSSRLSVDFDGAAACTDCGACTGICPAKLEPRRLTELLPSPGGLAFAGLPASTHCLRCGACVEICEHMMRKQPGPAAMGFRSGSSQAPSTASATN